MWISKAAWEFAFGKVKETEETLAHERAVTARLLTETIQLKQENTRQRADIDWFKLRLNAVEKERAQLIAAAIGVKVSIPEFLPQQVDRLSDALTEMPDLSTVGNDALGDEKDPVDYSMIPGYRGEK